jgi:DNA-binding NtrC family response regulator
MNFSVLIVEDDPVLGGSLSQRLALEGLGARWVATGGEAIAAVTAKRPDVVFCDIRLPDMTGEAVFTTLTPVRGSTQFVFMTAFGDVDQAVRLMKAGASDYLTKPVSADEVLERLKRFTPKIMPTTPIRLEGPRLPAPLAGLVRRLAPLDGPVLVLGETGVGKEVVARALHDQSPRAKAPFVAVNCGAIPQDLLESQMFGHERGAFTGAIQRHVGYFEEVGEGTLFLDEIGELDPRLQVALLRVLQDREFRRVGAPKPQRFTGRIVAATNVDPKRAIEAGRFRADLYYRLAPFEVTVPPLRDRLDEIDGLATAFVREFSDRHGLPAKSIDPTALSVARAQSWPGNIRELRNRIERALALGDGASIEASDLFPEMPNRPTAPSENEGPRDLKSARVQAELREIETALSQAGGRVADAAARLGISRTTLWKRLKQRDGG